MIPFLLFIPPDLKNKELVLWTFKTAVRALNLKHVEVDDKENPGFETVVLNEARLQTLLTGFEYRKSAPAKYIFNEKGIILNHGKEDELFTAFYLINCLQEYNSSSVDALGRFKYEGSYQEKHKNVTQNFVTDLFESYFKKNLPHPFRNRVSDPSRFFFSHDIDSLYGAFFQDGLAALKKGRLDVITKLILNTIFLKPEWFNIDKILKIDNEYDLRSTFFWIVNKGRVNKALTNADYNIRSSRIKETISMIKDKGSHVGLHKSISTDSFDEEKLKLFVPVIINRNHYLRFTLPTHFDELEKSSLKIDCSLGYAEQYGFRNNLAIPFVPFNLTTMKPYSFLEVPLNVMDGTFQKYLELSPEETSKKIIEFIEKNKSNSIISVLWHNHFFSSYRFNGYFEPYKELLEYLLSQKLKAVSPDQLYNKYFFSV